MFSFESGLKDRKVCGLYSENPEWYCEEKKQIKWIKQLCFHGNYLMKLSSEYIRSISCDPKVWDLNSFKIKSNEYPITKSLAL